MKNIGKVTICLLTSICVLLSAQSSVYAVSPTQVTIEIKAGTGPTHPVNPEDPGENLVGEPQVTGSLVILSVSHFNFGTITATGTTQKHNITTYQPNIQVVDLRGTGTGWSVSATASGFISNGSSSLPGAVIRIAGARPNSQVSSSYAPTQIANVALTTDNESVKVITAPDGHGMGLWVMRWYPSDEEPAAYITLEIPAGVATLGNHTATINWTLKDTP